MSEGDFGTAEILPQIAEMQRLAAAGEPVQPRGRGLKRERVRVELGDLDDVIGYGHARALELIAVLTERLAAVPEEYRATVEVSIAGCDSDGCFQRTDGCFQRTDVYYDRPENDQEMQARLQKHLDEAASYRRAVEVQERAEYERLKAIFEPKE